MSSITTSSITSSTLTATMAWEFWSLGRARILSALFGIACLNALYYHLATSITESLPIEVQENLFLATFFTDITLIVLNLLLMSRDAASKSGMELEPRVFLLPLPTWRLVLSKMLFPVAAAGALWVAISALTLAVASSGATIEGWPMLGPALAASTLTAWGLAVFWLPLRPRPLKSLVVTAVLVGLMVWTVLRFDDDGAVGGIRLWTSVTPQELATFAVLLLAAYATAVFGTIRARRGGTVGFSNLAVVLEEALSRLWRRGADGPFSSPAAAQVWFEWRQKGWVIPSCVGCGLIATAVMAGRGGNADAVLPALSKVLLMVLCVAPPMVGCLIGRFSPSSREASIDLFRASRPMSDTALANAILKVGALSLAVTWAVALATVAAILGVLDLLGNGGQLERGRAMVQALAESAGRTDVALGLAGLLVVSWANMALVAVVFLVGRNSVVLGLFLLPYVLGLGVLIFQRTLPSEVISTLLGAASWALGAGALVLTVTAFVAARRKRLIGRRLPWLCAGFWLVAGLLLAWRQADWLGRILDSGSAWNVPSSCSVRASWPSSSHRWRWRRWRWRRTGTVDRVLGLNPSTWG